MVGANTPMSRLDDLPPDQRAALSLLLRRNKSYAEIAVLLSIQERAVHDRAHAALAVLAPREARELAAERREEIGDYLLGQRTSMAERLETRTYLERSAPARAWAKAIAAELAPLAAGPLPEIPGGAGSRAAVPDAANQPSPPRGNPARDDTAARAIPSSRLGGALLLATIVAGVAVAVILSTSSTGQSPARTLPAPPLPAPRAHPLPAEPPQTGA
jgi:Sigma-70, region 4